MKTGRMVTGWWRLVYGLLCFLGWSMVWFLTLCCWMRFVSSWHATVPGAAVTLVLTAPVLIGIRLGGLWLGESILNYAIYDSLVGGAFLTMLFMWLRWLRSSGVKDATVKNIHAEEKENEKESDADSAGRQSPEN